MEITPWSIRKIKTITTSDNQTSLNSIEANSNLASTNDKYGRKW